MKNAGLICGAALLGVVPGVYAQNAGRPNLLLITVDDMNFNSIGVFGCPVKDITPNIDRLAGEGALFRNAYVQSGASQPSRNVLATGLYGYNSGVEGFNFIPEDSPVVSSFELLQQAGYFTGALAKLGHCFPKRSGVTKLDMAVTAEELTLGRDPERYYQYTTEFFNRVKQSGKPFFLMANSQDPHRPFWGSAEEVNHRNSGRSMYGDNPTPYPSRIITEDDLTAIPGFLPDLADIRKELTQYYNNVRRADDTVGEVLRALDESGLADNTLVVFLSDNGMSFPFAKTNCYVNSTRTPMIVRWSGVVKPGRVEDRLVSAVDFLPTVLDIMGLKAPYRLDGASYKELLYGKPWQEPEYVYTLFASNSGQNAEPMRCLQNRDFAYVFSPWADGEREFKSETTAGLSFKAMQAAAAQGDKAIAERVRFFKYRTLEEFYDLRHDPDALHNLIDDPAYAGQIDKFRKAMEQEMQRTNDHALPAFRSRHDPVVLKSYMEAQQAKADGNKKGNRKK